LSGDDEATLIARDLLGQPFDARVGADEHKEGGGDKSVDHLMWIPWERIQYAGDLLPSSGYLRLSSGRWVLSGGLTSLLPV
jgi:hypothetical protein